ncbi:unnamed protein product [Fraxinus pennsylvanica]|uniref:30S ribosomal protein 3, chloroplastic n=1 Tax=Fraxinus pennsylvanica TaxID=56036 RepID=A0AAD2DG16_9LAMI|nr:unnamed protein product [Fraxinus pennsylvanica]
MLVPLAIQQNTGNTTNYASNFQNPAKPPKNPSFTNTVHPPNTRKLKPINISCSSSSPTRETSSILENNGNNQDKRKLGVVVKPMERPRLVLKFIWMEKNIGLAIDQVIPGGRGGTIPLSPFYFWPRKDACEELKVMLERKPWISKKQKVVLLSQAAHIINLWQQRNGSC